MRGVTLVAKGPKTRGARTEPTTDTPGLLVVQIDGLSLPVLHNFVRDGRMPTMARLLDEHQLTLTPWAALLPPVTPASQAGILHGRNDGIPAFRWYEKATDRLLIANHAEDATEIVRRISDGNGLLARTGASIGNLATGDARISHLTMATIEGDPSGIDRAGRAAGFPRDPLEYLRIAILTVAELFREATQSRRQRLDDVRPRMYRGFRYAMERAVGNVPLRILSTRLVVHEMERVCPVIYVDFTGYDVVAHHCGPERPEAQDAARLIDDSIGRILQSARAASRPYRLVVLSDHGQSLGWTFRQRYGQRLEDLVLSLMGRGSFAHVSTQPVHDHDSIGRLLTHLARALGVETLTRRLQRALPRGHRANTRVGRALDDHGAPLAVPADVKHPDVVVTASGNLAHIYLTAQPGRLSRDQIAARYPVLVDGLARHRGIGLVMVQTEDGPIAMGRDGSRNLETGVVQGSDPLAPFGDFAEMGLRRLSTFDNCGDIVAVGRFDRDRGEVVQFEELIGSHGGLGGRQAEPFLAHPTAWPVTEPLVGAPALYRQLHRWMEDLGIGRGTAEAQTRTMPKTSGRRRGTAGSSPTRLAGCDLAHAGGRRG